MFKSSISEFSTEFSNAQTEAIWIIYFLLNLMDREIDLKWKFIQVLGYRKTLVLHCSNYKSVISYQPISTLDSF